MKKIASLFVIASFMLSVNAVAQSSMAYLNTKTAKQEVDKQTIILTFQLDNVDKTTQQKYADSFKKEQVVKDVTMKAGDAPNKIAYSLKMMKGGTMEALQRMFIKAQIPSVTIDGQVVATKDLVAYKDKKQAANKKK
ncbi:MAG: hypothetical protein ACJ77K_01975 [Bacteroidia bacterium]